MYPRRRLPAHLERCMAELTEAAREWSAARAYVRGNPHLLALLDDATARDVCEGVPAKGLA